VDDGLEDLVVEVLVAHVGNLYSSRESSFLTTFNHSTDFTMRNALDVLLDLLENPLLEKNYRELKKYYDATGAAAEAQAVQHLINTRFGDDEDNDVHPVQATG
jgi:hypothetical protein